MSRTLRLLSREITGLAVVCVLLHWPDSGIRAQVGKSNSPQNAKWDAMVEALVSRNQEPKLVKTDIAKEPLFVPDYNWDEQRRVQRAWFALARNDSPELWEQLLKHLDDKRYSLTVVGNGPSAYNFSVGTLCSLVVDERLYFATRWHSNPDSRDRPDIRLDPGIKNVVEWRSARANKSLCELQIELCERALMQVESAKDEDIPIVAKRHITMQLHKWIEELHSTKRAFFFPIPIDRYEPFTPEMAKGSRERIRAKPQGHGGKKGDVLLFPLSG